MQDNTQSGFIHSFQVRFHEVDRAGILFFGHIFTRAHDAYEDLMTQLGLNLAQDWTEPGYILPIINAEATYQAPFRHGMAVDILLTIPKIGNASFTTTYAFLGKDKCQHAQVRLVHCCVDINTGKARMLPDTLRRLLANYSRTN